MAFTVLANAHGPSLQHAGLQHAVWLLATGSNQAQGKVYIHLAREVWWMGEQSGANISIHSVPSMTVPNRTDPNITVPNRTVWVGFD